MEDKMNMHSISKTAILACLSTIMFTLSPLASARNTTWTAGSIHVGTVTVAIENGPNVVWKCDGISCTMSGPWGNQLSLDSCQSLVTRVGKISFYKNSAGKIWDKNSHELAQCNQSAR